MNLPNSRSPDVITIRICVIGIVEMFSVHEHPSTDFYPLIQEFLFQCARTPVYSLICHLLPHPRTNFYNHPLRLIGVLRVEDELNMGIQVWIDFRVTVTG